MTFLRFPTLFALLLAFAALPLAGCDSSSDDDSGSDASCPPANQASGTFTATAGGSSFDAACIQVIVTGSTFSITGIENFGQTGTTAQEQINLNVFGASAGQYSLPLGGSFSYAINQSGSVTPDTYGGVSGSITLTELTDTSAKGTFSFTGVNMSQNQIEVTSGSFDVTF
ncbi:MAG: DUF6252 family protein [Bacteroidota bacterium]